MFWDDDLRGPVPIRCSITKHEYRPDSLECDCGAETRHFMPDGWSYGPSYHPRAKWTDDEIIAELENLLVDPPNEADAYYFREQLESMRRRRALNGSPMAADTSDQPTPHEK